ncbi:MAG: hypothetical protein VX438_15385, partial [Planctomycetota bacterium]|nr:hypothetical protein [Planctomycetota bacterium]
MKSQIKIGLLTILITGLTLTQITAQQHPIKRGDLSPGTIGRATASRRQNVFQYVQPTELVVPKKTKIAYFSQTGFALPKQHKTKLGLQIGEVYRFKITMIEGFEGLELYPSVELVDRLYPAREKYIDFSIPIHLSQQDLEDALNGQLLTKVIYLEDPNQALPVDEIENEQRSLIIGAGEDPLQEAENLGRPVAILRLGSRTPDKKGIENFGAPPVTDYSTLKQKPFGDGARWSSDGSPWPQDEYLFDGGDKNRKAKIGPDFSIKGLDIEDTIIHFDTLDGERRVTETNRVPIYSPRFASVQKKYGLIVSHQTETFADVANREGMAKGRYTDFVINSTQQIQPRGTLSTKSSSLFWDQDKGLSVYNKMQ